MRILNWVQNKIAGGKQLERKPDVVYPTPPSRYHAALDTRKEEFSDWPHGLLAIGTFGNRTTFNNISAMEEDVKNFTMDQVNNLQKQLENMILGGDKPSDAIKIDGKIIDTGLNGELDDDDTDDDNCGGGNDDERRQTTSKINLSGGSKGRMFGGNNIAEINHRSISFLCRKIFACRGGFAGVPTVLRDHLPQSNMEKIMKTILHKKIYPQNNTTPALTRKYSHRKLRVKKNVGGEEEIIMSKSKQEDGSKWVKTDSEFIVLEI